VVNFDDINDVRCVAILPLTSIGASIIDVTRMHNISHDGDIVFVLLAIIVFLLLSSSTILGVCLCRMVT
jgi:hypothetical protein